MVTVKKIGIALLLAWCLPLVADAQTSIVAARIKSIKLDPNSLYAEATMKEKEDAFKNAHALFAKKVREWIQFEIDNGLLTIDNGLSIDSLVAKADASSQELTTSRGGFCRAFVFIRKRDILNNSQYPITNNQNPVADDDECPLPLLVSLTEVEKGMLGITQFYDIEPYIKGLKADGRVKSYGKYATMPQGEPCHVFVYDRQGDIKAVLRVRPDSQVNLQTMQEDNIRNYKNCGAIWLQLKDE